MSVHAHDPDLEWGLYYVCVHWGCHSGGEGIWMMMLLMDISARVAVTVGAKNQVR